MEFRHIKEKNGLIWEHLDKRMKLLRHMKIIVSLGINHVELNRTKADHIFKRKLQSPAKKQKTYRKYFPDSKNVSVFPFGSN